MKNFSNGFLWAVTVLWFIVGGCTPSKQSQSHDYFQTHWQEESQFIIENITSDLAEEIYYAKFHCLPDAKYFLVTANEAVDSPLGRPVYELQINLDKTHRGLKTKLEVNRPIWAPEVYAGLVTSLAEAVALNAGRAESQGDTKLLAKLEDGLAATLEEENQNLSKALEADFTDSPLHEQAAVLLGAFTLREHSGDFFDIRSPLCRITAHLAMANYFNSGRPFGINGQMAEAMLWTLMNDQTAALEKLRGIGTNDEAVAAWVPALLARNTSDYRPLDKMESLPEIQSIEWFDALDTAANTDVAWSKLSDVQKQNPDFVRIAIAGRYTVGVGHELLALSLPAELNEAAATYEMAQGKKLTAKNLVEALNEMPDRCFLALGNKTNVHIIGWGLWAGFFQRQLCQALQQNFDFLQRKWGVPDEAKTFSSKCDQSFDRLRLYPFVRRFNCTDVSSYHKSVDDGFKVTVATPQLVPARCWNYLCYWFTPTEWYKPNPNPHVNEWHKHNPPPGTAYNPLPRLDHPSLTSHSDAVDKLHEIAPYDRDIAWYIWKTKYHEKPTYEQAMALFQPVLDYDYYAMEKVADAVRDQPERYEAFLKKAAAVNPSDYFKLAEYFEGRDPDKAAGYLEKGNSLDPDSVRASYYASWLIKYYLKNGRTEDARHEADFAGDVYSSDGLQAKAEFLEATGDYDGAFQWFSNMEERYDESGPIIAFCLRYKTKTGDTRFDSELKRRLSKIFPKGIEKVGIGDFHAGPTDGVLIKQATDLTRAAGLRVGDVIVAVFGIRVHNFAQYDYGRDATVDPELDLIVWQGSGYREIRASPPNHRFGGDFGDYHSR